MSTLSEQEFRVRGDEALEGAQQALLPRVEVASEPLEFIETRKEPPPAA